MQWWQRNIQRGYAAGRGWREGKEVIGEKENTGNPGERGRDAESCILVEFRKRYTAG